MITLREVEEQLKRINVAFAFWGRPEMLELQHILIPGEQIQGCLNGRYSGGFAMLCATDQRLLLIDKKILFLSVEDIRYDMIAEVDYSHQFIDATIKVCTPNKTLTFTSFRKTPLRDITSYLQHRVLQIRMQHEGQQQEQPQVAPLAQQFTQPQAQPLQEQLQPEEPQMVASLQPAASTTAGYTDMAPSVARTLPGLPIPRFINPYTSTPLMIRKRIGRFNSSH